MSGMDKGMHGMAGEGATSAVYVTIDNTGSQADALVVGRRATAAQTVELHEVKNDGGMMKMRPVQKIPLPAGGKVELKPGGYHVMLIGLTRDLKPGETVPVTLVFEHGAEVQVDAAGEVGAPCAAHPSIRRSSSRWAWSPSRALAALGWAALAPLPALPEGAPHRDPEGRQRRGAAAVSRRRSPSPSACRTCSC